MSTAAVCVPPPMNRLKASVKQIVAGGSTEVASAGVGRSRKANIRMANKAAVTTLVNRFLIVVYPLIESPQDSVIPRIHHCRTLKSACQIFVSLLDTGI